MNDLSKMTLDERKAFIERFKAKQELVEKLNKRFGSKKINIPENNENNSTLDCISPFDILPVWLFE